MTFPILPSGGSTGYQIPRSLRFRSSASAYLSRTPGSAVSRTTWTWSGWVKRGALTTSSVGGVFGLFGGGILGTSQSNFVCYFNVNYDIYLQETVNNVTNQLIYETTSFYRDPAAWYHIIVAMDTTQATATNRTKVYVNGVQAPGAFSVTPSQNQALSINNNVPQYIGGASVNPQAYGNVLAYFDGYMAEINFVDGQQLTPSSFGQTDSVTGIWKPKKYTGTYGTAGYYLNFNDNSGVTATTIGKDNSGNSNNWTPTNISITSGATYDSMIDTPTPYADGGNGRGNYPTFNPLKKVTSNFAITDGNLTASDSSSLNAVVYATMFLPSSGKWYWEVINVAGSGLLSVVGAAPESYAQGASLGSTNFYRSNGQIQNAAGTNVTSGNTYTNGDIIGVAVDVDNGTTQFYKNGVAQGSTPSTTFTAGSILAPYCASDNSAGTKTFTANFGQRPFAYTPPAGFKSLNTQNLPIPTIKNGANYMAATTYTGTGANQTISNAINGVSFQPDLVWMKIRSAAANHVLIDVVRGYDKYIATNSTVAEATSTDQFVSFNSNGFTLGANAGAGGSTNQNGSTYVGWQWDAGTTTVTNSSGTISSQVRANPSAGFSIVTYTGTGANATVGHGHGDTPKMVIVKMRSSVASWLVWHSTFTGTEYIVLESTAAKTSLAAMWNSAIPTSTVLNLGTNANTNGSGSTYVAYCFSEVSGYSKFGSYTGTGTTDGPFVYTGFRPRFVLIKRSDSTGNWFIWDVARNANNTLNNQLYPDANPAEAVQDGIDFLSNGFKLWFSSTFADRNANGGTYIYMAFAENPFKYSLAR